MKVPYDEGVAIHIAPGSCGRRREAACEALTGACIGQPLSGVRLHNRSADALQSAEGNIVRRAMQATFGLRVVVRPWHVRTPSVREPRDLCVAPASRAEGRMGKAGGRSP